MIFLLFIEKILLNIEPSKITPDFYNNFSDFGGGGWDVPVSPPPSKRLWLAPLHLSRITNYILEYIPRDPG